MVSPYRVSYFQFMNRYLKKAISIIYILIFLACDRGNSPDPRAAKPEEDTLLWRRASTFFRSIPYDESVVARMDEDPKVRLGHYLFYDSRLSASGTKSCNSCHDLANYGMNNTKVAEGEGSLQGMRNVPTVFNAALHNIFFWDARSHSLEDQPGKMVVQQDERSVPHLGMIVDRLRSDTMYLRLFSLAFPGQDIPVSYGNAGRAISAFERTLLAPSRFDMYMDGDLMALNAEEKKGLTVFLEAGCGACHEGLSIGGGKLQKFGIHTDYRTLASGSTDDRGRMQITGDSTDLDGFKVPGLRNAAMTHPYFHNGSIVSLDSAVKVMAITELNRSFSNEEAAQVVAFLNTLTGDIRQQAKIDPFGKKK